MAKSLVLSPLPASTYRWMLALAAALVWWWLTHFTGVTWDERSETAIAVWHAANATAINAPLPELLGASGIWAGLPVPRDAPVYGLWQNWICLALQQGILGPSEEALVSPAAYEIKHHVVAMLLLLTVLGTALGTRLLLRSGWAWGGVAAAVLLLMPEFIGHGRFNTKDMAMACGYTWLTVAAITAWSRLRTSAAVWPIGLAVGVAGGLLVSVRMSAAPVVACVIVGCLVGPRLPLRRQAAFVIIALVMAALLVWLQHPVAWRQPLAWLTIGWTYFGGMLGKCTLMNGICVPSHEVPWSYLPTWFGRRIPEPFLLAAPLGLLLWLWRRRRALPAPGRWTEQDAAGGFWAAQGLLLPLAATLSHAHLYDTTRHFLFVFPAVAVFVTAAGHAFWQAGRLPARRMLAAGAALCALAIGYDLGSLRPYEYTYYNYLGRSGGIDGRWETDYWGLGMAEAVAWVNRSDPTAVILTRQRTYKLLELWLDPERTSMERPQDWQRNHPGVAFYYAGLHRYGMEQEMAHCPPVHVIRRYLTGVPLSMVTIRRCG